ncbi:MAG: methyltransferase domain-containing protein [Candidatus Edwardsbacteria bacterium]|jgi:SAM-dependent methyltransferase|nr:methyltransferase domain-containing protein [Candidatus Edwardsbacteria bacterium]
MVHKTDYLGHDLLYQRRKSEGRDGWNDDKDWQEWRADILDLIASGNLPASGKVLELGCGAGDVSLLFAGKGYQVSGIEISPTAVDWARGKALKAGLTADFQVGDVRDLGRWVDGHFNIVIDGHCLHCIIGGDRADVLSETYRVLKPGGVFYICTMCGDPKATRIREDFDPESRCLVSNGVAYRYLGRPEDVVRELNESGFKIVRKHLREVGDNQEDQDNLLIVAVK